MVYIHTNVHTSVQTLKFKTNAGSEENKSKKGLLYRKFVMQQVSFES
jgi:hypothetical protein